MKTICSKENCTGCGLCSVICPQKCISMREGLLGHLFPVIEVEKCINCGLCQKKCPVVNPVELRKPEKCFAAWAKDIEEYKSSTSGGAGSVFARSIIKKGGVVYGCSMQPNVKVGHIRVDNEEDLLKLKGSKYVQSSITGILPLLKSDVKSGIPVLFIGTPCQVAAVRRMFEKQPHNLYLVDLICHGVPSLVFLQQYVSKIVGMITVDDIKFRDGNGKYILLIYKNGHEVYRMPLWQARYKDLYLNAFIDGYINRESCHQCQYTCASRCSDVTIGDFWGLGRKESVEEFPSHPFGISVILTCSEKGILMVREVEKNMNLYERNVEEAVAGNDHLRFSKKANWRIHLFQNICQRWNYPEIYNILTFDQRILYYLKKPLKKLLYK